MKGILLVDKPVGWTSFDVVNYVRRIVARLEGKKPRNVKVGHTGTLDPAATGLLVLCVGRDFTKLVPTMIRHDKTYEVELTLGSTSTTGDREGEITDTSDRQPDRSSVEEAVLSFVGESMQTPPKFSALKINGKRAYDLARQGKEVVLQPRKIMIHSIESITYTYPKVTFTTSVGSGTYIRSLAEDVGTRLGTGAYMSNLRRTIVGDKNIAEAYTLPSRESRNSLEQSSKLDRSDTAPLIQTGTSALDLTDEILQKTLVD
jgi:tRNA pseudouridine55 synthase